MDTQRYGYTTDTLARAVKVGFAILGNPPFYPTGYGTQCRLLGEKLVADGFDVCHISDWEYSGPIMNWNGISIYPVSEYPGTLTSSDVQEKIAHFCAERDLDDIICIFLGDIWKWNEMGTYLPNSLIICPVDGSGLNPREVMAMGSFKHIAAMSEHGVDVIEEHTGMRPLYLPHGFDPEINNSVLNDSVRAIRSRWVDLYGKSARPPSKGDDLFIVGFFGDMSVRKEPEINLMGFRKFVESLEPEEQHLIRLYLKSKPDHAQGQDLSVYQKVGIPQQLVLTVPETTSKLGLNKQQMGRLLKGVDVLLHCSSQEGFGIFQIEAQSVGTPVINTDFGPMKKLNACQDLISPLKSHRTFHSTNYGQTSPEEIAKRLHILFNEWKDELLWKSRCQVVRDWALDWTYDEVYSKFISPQLESIVQGLKAPRIVIRKPTESIAHICFVSTYGTECGIATYTKMLSHALIDAGFKVSILAEITAEHPASDEIEEDEHGVEVYRCWSRTVPRWVMAEEILEKLSPDIIHAQHEWTMIGDSAPALRYLIAACKGGRVITWHTPDFPANPRAMSEFMLYDSICDLHVLHNRSKVPIIASQCVNGVTHIDHGILPMGRNPDARSIVGVAERAPMIFTYGFLTGGKGVHTLLKAAVEAVKQAPYFELVAYGGAHPKYPTHPDLLKECHDLASKSEQIHFIPELLSEEDIDLHCQAADYLAFPYEGELMTGSSISSSSGAVFRVLGSGKPVIASDEGRLRDIIGGIHGWKVAQGDVPSLTKAIVNAVNTRVDDVNRYRQMRYEVTLLADSLSWPKIAVRHSNAYEKLGSLWGVYSKDATGSFTGITGEGIDFMSDSKIQSSTGIDELSDIADDLKELPIPPTPDEFKRMNMINHIDSLGDEKDA